MAVVEGSRAEVQDGMCVEWDVPIEMDDGNILRADIFRPVGDGHYGTIMSMGAYGKGLPFQAPPYKVLWDQLCERYPEVANGSSNKYQAWEVADPERWVPFDYVVIRVDSRGAGRSEGFLDFFSAREAKDLHDCIEWAAGQTWSNGKVGLSGISYYAINQWQAAALAPPHLAAICPWEGASDWYREATHHGGILCGFLPEWFVNQAKIVQHGLGSRGPVGPLTGLAVCGDEDLTDDELRDNRAELEPDLLAHRFDDEYYRERSSDLSEISVPLLSAANWGGQSLHNRGNFQGFLKAASPEKWLEVHGGAHWAIYYTDYGLNLQRRFFDWYLKGEGDWLQQPPVTLQVRHPGERFVERHEQEWPIARTRWTRYHLDPGARGLSTHQPAGESQVTYDPRGEGVTLSTAPFDRETELTGPVACRLWISSETTDADIFLALRVFDPDENEVLFHGANEPKAPISLGWLRASHRRLDEEQSTEWAPFHPHLIEEPLVPGERYKLDIEIWPTSIVIPAGYTLKLSILGRDFDHGLEGVPGPWGPEMRGVGVWFHDDPRERPAETYDGAVTVYSGGDNESYLTVPVVPEA